ncbi:MAG TPA: sugar ABC transporter permease [Spirochaetota bacterium]|nr:sugar ABC transporter permease [Spirochaetota bacterium]HOL58091.1 sugar ABC transporter permease [Spirochaetota bacterium]HPP05584.1 sugar ABC transporter permease [Spirochaetota bacterium]
MRLNKNINKKIYFFIFIFPALFLYALFFLYPFSQGIYYSLTDWNGITPKIPIQMEKKQFEQIISRLKDKDREFILKNYSEIDNTYRLKINLNNQTKNKIKNIFKKGGYSSIKFIGFKNFIEIFTTDQRFPRVIRFTLFFTFFNVLFINLLGLIMALFLDMEIRRKNILRTMFFMPNIISLIIVAFIWSFIFQHILPKITGITEWLGDPDLAPISVVITSVWQGLGYIMVIYLAGLQSIPSDILEVAKIDGATGFTRFFKITLPLLLPAATISLFITLTNSLKTFEIMLALTNGGPGSATESYVLNIYNDAFSNNLFGYATAKAILLLLIIMSITLIQLSIMKKREIEL